MKAQGFTLIEVILVIVIMAVAIPSLISALGFLTQGQVNAIGTTTAADLAQEEMEAIIAKKRSACGTCGYANTPPSSCAAPLVGVFAQMSAPFSNYWKKTDAECVDSSLAPSATDQGYKKITVTVEARDVGPSVPDAVLVTILTDY